MGEISTGFSIPLIEVNKRLRFAKGNSGVHFRVRPLCRLDDLRLLDAVLGVQHGPFVRSFARPSRLDPTRIGGGSWVTCCCKTVHTLVRRMAILAESVQLWPMTSENSSSQIFLNCHRMDGRPCLRLGSVEKFCCHSLVGVHVLVAAAQEFC